MGRQVEGCRWEMRRLAVRVQVGAVMSCHPSWGRHPHRALRSARRRWRQRARPVPAFLTCLRLSPPARAADFGLAFPELLQSASGVSRWTVGDTCILGGAADVQSGCSGSRSRHRAAFCLHAGSLWSQPFGGREAGSAERAAATLCPGIASFTRTSGGASVQALRPLLGGAPCCPRVGEPSAWSGRKTRDSQRSFPVSLFTLSITSFEAQVF